MIFTKIFTKSKLITTLLFITSFLIIPITNPTKSEAKILMDTSPYVEIEETINFNKNIDTNLILIGTNVYLNGNINGDVTIISNNTTVEGKINGDLRVISLYAEIKGMISDSLIFFTKDIITTSISDIEKDAYGITQSISHDGRIGRNLNLGFSPNTIIKIDGKILGNLIYTDSRPIITNEAYILGETIKIDNPLKGDYSQKDLREFIIFSKIFHSIILIIIAGFLLSVRKSRYQAIVDDFSKDILKKSLSGFGFLFISLFFCTLLFLTFFGIPLALSIIGVFYILYFISFIFAAGYISKRIFSKDHLTIAKIGISIVILDVITIIPVIGNVILLMVYLLFLGQIAKYLFVPTNLNSNNKDNRLTKRETSKN